MRMHRFIAIGLSTCAFVSMAQGAPKPIETRFGTLTWNADGQLQFRGSTLPVQFAIGSSELLSHLKLAASDVILLQQGEGNSCPGRFVFITVTQSKAEVTPAFGTCYDELPEATLKGSDVIVQIPGENGPVTYVLRAGRVLAQ